MVHDDCVHSWLRNIIAYNVLNSGIAVVVRFNLCEAQIFSSCGHCSISLFNVIIIQVTKIIVSYEITKQTSLITYITCNTYTYTIQISVKCKLMHLLLFIEVNCIYIVTTM